MRHLSTMLATLAFAVCATAPISHAASLVTSSASESAGSSAGSASDSVSGSSKSSTGKTGVAAGDYKVIDMVALADRPGMVRLALQGLDPAHPSAEIALILPQAAAAKVQLATGAVITAVDRPYGTEFAQGDKAFFLVLADDWHRELASRPVVL